MMKIQRKYFILTFELSAYSVLHLKRYPVIKVKLRKCTLLQERILDPVKGPGSLRAESISGFLCIFWSTLSVDTIIKIR